MYIGIKILIQGWHATGAYKLLRLASAIGSLNKLMGNRPIGPIVMQFQQITGIY